MRIDEVLGGTVMLGHGAAMPRIGLGTWPLDDAEAERVVAEALAAGYRLVDTAENYGNENGVGAGLRAGGVPRDEVFVTTKFNRQWHSVDGVAAAFESSAARLGLEYIDLMLVHWPNPDQGRYVEAWQGLVSLLANGSVRAIGVSNFTPEHVSRIISATGVVPDVNQVQLNPRYAQRDTRRYDGLHGIVTQSWSPLGQGNSLLAEPVILAVAARIGCSPAQAVLAWHLARGLAVVPKSADPARLRQNLASALVTLDEAALESLDAMDGLERPEYHPDAFGH
jgi:2,5-diketo-D-gluconate reductase A